jgi:hypothetical protein
MESAIAGLDQLICIIKLQSTNTYLLSLVDEKRAMLVFFSCSIVSNSFIDAHLK